MADIELVTLEAAPLPEPVVEEALSPIVAAYERDGKPMWRLLGAFLGPLLFSNVVQLGSQTAGMIFVGRLVSTGALGAITASFPIATLLLAAITGLASGGTVLMAQAFGAGDQRTVKKIAGTVLVATFLLSVAVCALGLAESTTILTLLRTPSDIMGLSDAYLRWIFIALPVLAPYGIYGYLIRATGDSKTPFYALIVSSVLTIVLTPAFILGWFGLPKLGVVSVAVAMLAGGVAASGWMVYRLDRRGHPLRIDAEMLAHFRIDGPVLGSVLRIGVASTVQDIIVCVAELATLSFVNSFGSAATASFGAIAQVLAYVQFPALAVGTAATIFSAQWVGAGKRERLGTILRSALGLNFAVAIPVIAACYLLAPMILQLFITDPVALRIAEGGLQLMLWSMLIFGMGQILTGIMRGTGTVKWPTTISILSVWLVEVPVGYYASVHASLNGVWLAGPLGLCAALAAQYAYYELVWKRASHERLV